MTESTRRLWGIDIIAGIYGFAAMLLVWLFFNGSSSGRFFAMILIPVCVILCVGVAFRVNLIRILFLILLGISLVGDGLLSLYLLLALTGILQAPPNIDPIEQLIRMSTRVGAALAMFLYLRRPDVRDAFRGTTRHDDMAAESDVKY